MTRGKRAGAVLAIGMTALSATSLALAETTSPRASEATAFATATAEAGGSRLDPRHASLRQGPARARSRRGAFPIRGGVADYGESGAQYGDDRGGRMHEGQDMFAPAGTPLLAVRDGVVLETGNDGGRGNYIALFSPQARETYLYLHMREPAEFSPGDRVRAGSRVGRLGCTGSCFGDHLHFEVRAGRSPEAPPRNPMPLLRRSAR